MISRETLKKLWPHAPQKLIDAISAQSGAVFDKYKINTSLRIAHFLAQVSHESDGGRITEENMNYTTAARIAAVWPSRFTTESAQPYVRNPRALADKVYNGRMGNAVGSDDGYNYRGRGLLQITGRESYDRIGGATGLSLEDQPELAYQPEHALEVAAAEFVSLGCLPFCDKDNIVGVTKRVNGGTIGLDSRRAWLTKWKLALPGMPGSLPEKASEIAEMDLSVPRAADPPATTAPPADTATKVGRATIATVGGGTLATQITSAINGPVTTAVEQVKQVIDSSGDVVGTTKAIVAKAPDGSWDRIMSVVQSPKFLTLMLIIVLAAWGTTWYLRTKHEKDAAA